MKNIDRVFPFPTQDEMLEGMRIRREFLKRNSPAEILKRQAAIDEASEITFQKLEEECKEFDESDEYREVFVPSRDIY